MEPHRGLLDVHCAAQIDDSIIPKRARKDSAGYIRRLADGEPEDSDMERTLARTRELRKGHRFFHWELEMTDAFTDTRYGFDLIVGNPPWDKVKLYDDEFFPQYYPAFRAMSPKTKKTARKEEILKDTAIKRAYEKSIEAFKEKSAFYKTYENQGEGDRDLWQLVLERTLSLVSKGGVISMLIPSQILSNSGSAGMREKIMDTDIRQMYVFENRRKIFPIDSRYRFILLTLRDAEGPDSFRAGFYLHDLKSLETEEAEGQKFHTLSKEIIRSVSPDTLQIPEVGGRYLKVLAKMSNDITFGIESEDGWSVAFSSGFHKTNDSDLFREGGKGWPVLEGKSIHQFNHRFARPEFVAGSSAGLKREKKKRVYAGRCRDFYHSFRLAFRDVSGPTNMRAVIATIMPPQRFHTNSLFSIVLTRTGMFESGNDYHRRIAYLCGILNSMPFDFAARCKMQMHIAAVIRTLPIPRDLYYNEIARLAARLSIGSDEFEGFAESLRIENITLAPQERIQITARLDALVAHAYGLASDEYETVLDSFKFTENPDLLEAKSADFNDNRVLRQFYGEVRKLAPRYFDEIARGQA